MRGVVSASLLIGLIVAPALGHDEFPPPWQRGGLGTTFQAWEFGNDLNPVPPDVAANPYGDPLATIYGVFEPPLRDTWWEPYDNGHEGVWSIGGALELYLPNNPDPNRWKEIWLQITYDAGEDFLPHMLIVPEGTVERVESVDAGGGYALDVYHIIIQPNPLEEWIYIYPRFCQIHVDEVVVDTICIPEPATLALLALGGLALLRRRRGYGA